MYVFPCVHSNKPFQDSISFVSFPLRVSICLSFLLCKIAERLTLKADKFAGELLDSLLIYCLPFPAFKILKDKCSKLVQRSKKRFSIIGFGELLHKALQVGIGSNHKSSDRNF